VTLARKTWRESRARFLTGAAALMFFCVLISQADLNLLPPYERPTFTQYVWRRVYDGNVRLVFVLIAVMLGLGGLRREHAAGTAAFTLALPVSRLRLDAVRVATGWLQVGALACIPLLIVPALSPYYQDDPYPAGQALRFAVLASIGGIAWFSIGFLCSVCLGNAHSSAAAGIAIPFVNMALASAPGISALPTLDLFNIMSGDQLFYLDQETRLLVGSLPWFTLTIVLLVSMMMTIAGVRLTERQDF
jgi:ABC-type transport system involved in multi-copper enzyme maturation permease subunit